MRTISMSANDLADIPCSRFVAGDRLIKFQNEENVPYGEAILAARLRPAI